MILFKSLTQIKLPSAPSGLQLNFRNSEALGDTNHLSK